jgi:hypothetical protein
MHNTNRYTLQVDDQHCSLIEASLGSLAALLFAEKAIRELCSQWIPDQLNNSCLIPYGLIVEEVRGKKREASIIDCVLHIARQLFRTS